jgi:hypothetical protein
MAKRLTAKTVALPARGERATPEACFQHDVRGGGTCKRQSKLLPLIPTVSPWGTGRRGK